MEYVHLHDIADDIPQADAEHAWASVALGAAPLQGVVEAPAVLAVPHEIPELRALQGPPSGVHKHAGELREVVLLRWAR